MRVGVINGPNLNMLGVREPGVYGAQSLSDLIVELKDAFSSHQIEDFQSNDEGELISKIQKWGMVLDGIVINPGGYSHTSVAIRDAIASITAPVIEVHISNILSREDFRKKSFLSDVCTGIISGLGLIGYEAAIKYFIEKND